ncbi:hypothetical protein Q9966_011471 [Columba livia]|nr:hypothetical protein Q9966_011471 [Columba livia]
MGVERRRRRKRRRKEGSPRLYLPPGSARCRLPPVAAPHRSAPHGRAQRRAGQRPWAAGTPRPAAREGEVPQGLLKM